MEPFVRSMYVSPVRHTKKTARNEITLITLFLVIDKNSIKTCCRLQAVLPRQSLCCCLLLFPAFRRYSQPFRQPCFINFSYHI